MPLQAVLVDCDAGQRRSLMDLLQHYRCAQVVVSAVWVKLQMGASAKVSASHPSGHGSMRETCTTVTSPQVARTYPATCPGLHAYMPPL